ncbi:MAG TPA: wax ester/triacylglycerol synthase family O-acyltransferase [Bryobacteraceae bacterium]|nr:wax ester/triacylglycerol synthase family O-acyltransferase [Bryobacteraceae bacterium]
MPQLPQHLGALDAAFLNFETKEMPLHIGGVCVFEGSIPFERYVATIESKLDAIPRYRQKVMRPFLDVGYPTWQVDPDFDIRRHIFHLKLDSPGSDEQLRELTGRIFTPLLDRNKPLWETYVVDGLSGGRSAVICKVHHCIVDGVAGIGLLTVMMETSPEEHRLPRKKRHPAPKPPDSATLFVDAFANSVTQIPKRLADVRDALVGYGAMLWHDNFAALGLERVADMMPELLSPLEHLPFNRPCSGERQVFWTEFPFAEAHAIKKAYGCTVNDVILTVVAGAVSRYTKLHGQTVKNRFFRPLVPVNVRPPGESIGAFGNLISLLPITLPLGIREPIARLKHIHEQTEAMKGARMPELVRLGLAWLGLLPPPVQAFLAENLGWLNTPVPLFHMVCTNVPGPQIPLYACGKRMVACYPHVPTGMDVGISVAIESYNQTLYFALTTDALAAPDGARMKEFLEQSFHELRKAAGIQPEKRPRVSGLPAAREERLEQLHAVSR